MPFPLARPSHYLWFHTPAHTVRNSAKARRVLGYQEQTPPGEALINTVHWLVEHRDQYSAEWEHQIDDAFDYAAEDALIAEWKAAYARLDAIEVTTKPPAHRYRRPSAPGEAWRRPDRARSRERLEYY